MSSSIPFMDLGGGTGANIPTYNIPDVLSGSLTQQGAGGIPTEIITPGVGTATPGAGATSAGNNAGGSWFNNFFGGGLGNQTPTQPGGTGLTAPLSGTGIFDNLLGGLGSAAGVPSINWFEELAIRTLLVLVGITLIAGGLYSAGQRASAATTARALARSVL